MTTSTAQGVYGSPQSGLASPDPDARQFSPLHPGAAALETQAAGTLAGFVMVAPPGTAERRYATALMLLALAVEE